MNRHRVRATVSIGLATGLLALAGCAIDSDDTPRDIEGAAAVGDATTEGLSGAAAVGSGRIFLLAPDVPGLPTRLQAVARDVGDDAVTGLRSLFLGPNDLEQESQLRTALPVGLTLRASVLRAGGVLSVDLSSEILDVSGDGLIAALAQIVFTAAELSAVTAVRITVDGQTVQWPTGSGELTSAPLTVYDYPGWDSSSQPSFPGVPVVPVTG